MTYDQNETYTPEEYSRWYIVQALFKLANEYQFDKINITDIVAKAGVGRATFYRYFKRKEDVILYYFEHNKKEFIFKQHFLPRCKDDYIQVVTNVLTHFKQQIEPLKIIRKARLEYIYLDYLNRNFLETFAKNYPNEGNYKPYLYAGMLFNVSMAWLDNGCNDSIESLAETIVSAIYYK